MKNKFIILGHGNVSLGIILDSLHSVYNEVEVTTIISNIHESKNNSSEISYLHEKIDTKELYVDSWDGGDSDDRFILSGMAPVAKEKIFEYFKSKYSIDSSRYVSVIHSSSVITNGVELSNSVNISPLSVIAQYAKLGDFVTINRNSSIGHHTIVDSFTSINPGCNIGGNCKIGKNVVIGIGATVFDDITIGDNAVIGGGAVVTKNVEENTLVYGSPAKFVRTI